MLFSLVECATCLPVRNHLIKEIGYNMQEYQWDDKSMSLEFLLQTEKQTTSYTLNVRGDDSVEINNLINIFFRLSYHCWEDKQLDSDEHWFISRAKPIYTYSVQFTSYL